MMNKVVYIKISRWQMMFTALLPHRSHHDANRENPTIWSVFNSATTMSSKCLNSVCHFPVLHFPVRQNPVRLVRHFPVSTFLPMLFGASLSRSVIYTSCYMVRHFPVSPFTASVCYLVHRFPGSPFTPPAIWSVVLRSWILHLQRPFLSLETPPHIRMWYKDSY